MIRPKRLNRYSEYRRLGLATACLPLFFCRLWRHRSLQCCSCCPLRHALTPPARAFGTLLGFAQERPHRTLLSNDSTDCLVQGRQRRARWTGASAPSAWSRSVRTERFVHGRLPRSRCSRAPAPNVARNRPLRAIFPWVSAPTTTPARRANDGSRWFQPPDSDHPPLIFFTARKGGRGLVIQVRPPSGQE